MSLDFSEISVVVSGPVIMLDSENPGGAAFNATIASCKSIRGKMPEAEIVFSTWPDEDVEGVDCDILIRSADPGGADNMDGGNVNRQICSRRAGIEAATRKYVLAMRSESHIINLDFLDYWDKYNDYSDDTEYKFLKKRVLIPATMPANRASYFHMGDWYYFGIKEDVLELWSLPYWKKGSRNVKKEDLMYNPHRYVITEFVRQHHELHFDIRSDINSTNREIYEKVLANNFVVIGFLEYGLDSYKYFYPKTYKWKIDQVEINYYHGEWIQLYNRYCNGNVPARLTIKEFFFARIYIPVRNKYRNTKRAIKALIYRISSSDKEMPFYEY